MPVTLQSMQTGQTFRLRASRLAFASVVAACTVANAKAKKQLLI